MSCYTVLLEHARLTLKNMLVLSSTQLALALQDKVAVNFGHEITKIVPGYVSTEVDARLSFDTEGTITKARKIIDVSGKCWCEKGKLAESHLVDDVT